MYEPLVYHKYGGRYGEPFVFAVAGGRICKSVVGRASEEPPLTLGELVETPQVGTTPASFAQKFESPLAQHPVFVEGCESASGLVLNGSPVRRGEIVGLGGVIGAGRSETVNGIYGSLKKSSGGTFWGMFYIYPGGLLAI